MTQNQFRDEDWRPPRASHEEMMEEAPLPPPPATKQGGLKGLSGDGNVIKTVVISLVVAILVFVVMGMMGGGSFVTKKDFEANWTSMSAATNESLANISQLRDTVNNAVQGIPNMVQSQITQSIANATSGFDSRITEITNQNNTTNTELASLKTQIQNLQTDIDALEVLIAELQIDGGSGGSDGSISSSDDLSLDIKEWYEDLYIELPETTTTPVAFTYEADVAKLTITNNLNKDIEDIRLEADIALSYSLPSGYDATLGGGAWVATSLSSNHLRFRSGRFDLDAGETERLYLTLAISGTQPADKPYKKIYFNDVDIDVDDYDIVN